MSKIFILTILLLSTWWPQLGRAQEKSCFKDGDCPQGQYCVGVTELEESGGAAPIAGLCSISSAPEKIISCLSDTDCPSHKPLCLFPTDVTTEEVAGETQQAKKQCFAISAKPITPAEEKYVPPIAPKLQIPIPELKLTDVFTPVQEGEQKVLYIPTIAEYAAGFYRYLIAIVGILAGVMITWAGVKWLMAAGNAEIISDAKHKIGGAIIGIILAVGSYIIMYLINPDLVTFKSLRIPLIAREEFVYEEGGDTDTGLQATTQDAQALGFACPGNGGAGAISQIIDSMKGKVAYRFGGKGKKGPPFDFSESKSEFLQYDNNCPVGNACLDCSGFINYVYKCAGLSTINGGTSTIFSGSEAINTIDWDNNTVNGIPLKAGDLLGFVAGEGGKAIGHVIMYIGNGQIAESKGGNAGRQPGGNPRIAPFGNYKKYPLKHIRRLP